MSDIRLTTGAPVAFLGALIAAVLLFSAMPTAESQESRIQGGVPTDGGIALVSWGGGSIDELVAESALLGCSLKAIWQTQSGSLVGYVVGSPDFVNQIWIDSHPDVLPAGTVLLLICEPGGAAGPPPTSTPTSTPTPTPTSTPIPTPDVDERVSLVSVPLTVWIANAELAGFYTSDGDPVVPTWTDCATDSPHLGWGVFNGAAVTVVGEGIGACSTWWFVEANGDRFFVPALYLSTSPSPPAGPSTGSESVEVLVDLGLGEVVVERSNGEIWLLDYGLGCLSLSFMEGRSVLVTAGAGGFGSFGSQIVISLYDDVCDVYGADDGLEWVLTSPVSGSFSSEVFARRANGSTWLLDYGIGCLSISFATKTVLIHSPGLFAGIGSQIIVPDRSQSCRIWSSERI